MKPATFVQISKILRLADDKKIPVFPRGGGTGLAGGAIPTSDGIILSTERLDKIEIDKENLMATAEAGVTLEKLIEAVEDAGLFFPLHPGEKSATIGGLVACNAGGVRAVKYGVMRNYVKGMEVVLPDGDTVCLGGKLLKDNTGYSFMNLLIGSEGTLGIITKVILRLYPRPAAMVTLIVPFENRHDAVGVVPKILQLGVIPLAIEYVEGELMKRSARHLGKRWPCERGKSFLIIVLTGRDEQEMYSECERISTICREKGSLEVLVAQTKEEQETILEIRSNLYIVLKPDLVNILDTTVPPAEIGRLMDAIDEVAEKYDAYIPIYGHVGDGNLHSHVMKRDFQNYEKIKGEIYEATVKLGGVITGEHGIGKIRMEILGLCLSGKEIELMMDLKDIFDQNNILNPR